ncbi:MAG: ABC transporter permease, partial [Clostridia bacterium]|nr:ABC transporter permease [Clostridia bacterium]
YTYRILYILAKQFREFFETVGEMGMNFPQFIKYALTFQVRFSNFINQCCRFAVDSLPITLTIVGMTVIIIAIQITPQMVKQGGQNYVGMMLTIVIVRELANIMAGFAIISMVGSSMAAEVATMRVSEQIDAMQVLKVNPIKYLYVPRVLAGTVMMPIVVIVATLFGIICGGVASWLMSDVSWLNYINSAWHGVTVRDIGIFSLKAASFGAAITYISCSCGYFASGGAKGVGQATTKAVVWSFVTIAIIDTIFAMAFFL